VLKDLNKQQREAVTHTKGPLLIIAGAGTGKTKVITYRIAYLIEKKLAQPSEILALTFTEKAAEEMEARVDLLLPYGIFDLDIMTFHSFGDKLLKEYAPLLGLPLDFKLLNKIDQLIFLKDHIYDLPLKILRPVTNPTSHLNQLAILFSRLKEENISPQIYIKWAQTNKKKVNSAKNKNEAEIEKAKIHQEVAQTFKKYEDLLRQENALDFADLIYLAYKLLKEHPDIREKLQKKYKNILVDEFQDTNFLQNEILKLLVSKEKNITVVGDDDQSIFRWRGASLSNILFFQKDFPKAKKIVLAQNYRSPQEILDLAYKIIQHNNPDRLEVKAKINKHLVADFSLKDAVVFKNFDHVQSEADFIIQQIKELQKKIPLKEVAILLRSNSLATHYIKALNSAGIPYIFSGESGIYFKPEVSMLISFIKAIISNNDRLAYHNLAQSEIYNIDLGELAEIFDLIRRQNLSVFKTFQDIKKYQHYLKLSKETLEKLQHLAQDIKQFRQNARTLSGGQIVYEFIKKKDIIKRLSKAKSLENDLKTKNIADFFNKIILEFEKASSDHSIYHLGEYLEDLLSAFASPEIEEIDPDLEAVRVLTYHAAKGLEFEIVFMPALTSDYLPTKERTEMIEMPKNFIHEILPQGDYHLQEERRLFYVGSTRAKQCLFLTYASDYGGKRIKKPSPFLYEALGKELILKSQKIRLSKLEQINLFAQGMQKKRSLIEPKAPLVLSYSAIDDYITCPLKYKFVKILRVPVLRSYPVAFGASVHETINEYYKNLTQGNKLDEKKLLAVFRAKWKNEGYLHKTHERAAFKEGRKAIKNFFKSDFSRVIPLASEKPFSVSLGNDVIKGKFDLIFKGKNGIKILDFKTSFVNQATAERRVRESLQLKIYAWAYFEGEKILPNSLGLVFINSNKLVEIKPDKSQFFKLEQKIKEVGKNIREKKFEATPTEFACRYCAFRENCPFAYR